MTNHDDRPAASPVADLLGPTLVRDAKGGDEISDEISVEDLARATKTVVLYFSAHWCPPCRRFTPILSRAYAEYKSSKKNGDDGGFELVFVSSDRDAEAFREYHAEMSFPALPYEARDVKEELSAKFRVRGIPHLVAVDVATGEEDASVAAAAGDLRSFVAQHGAAAFPLTRDHVRTTKAAAEKKRALALEELAASDVAVSVPASSSSSVDGGDKADENAENTSTIHFRELLRRYEHVGLVYGDGDASDATYGKILAAAEALGGRRFVPVYVGWTAYEGQSDHPALWERFHAVREEALTDEVRSLLGDIAGEKVEHLTVAVIKSEGSGLCGVDGTCEPAGAPVIVSVDKRCRALNQFGPAAFPWDEAAVKNALEVKQRRLEDLKGRLPGFDFLRDNEGGSRLVRGTGDEGSAEGRKERKYVSVDDLLRSDEAAQQDSAVLGLYFSAHWCRPCRAFTPELLKQYEEIRANRGMHSFEIVFVSFDKDEKEFDAYYSSMMTPKSKENWLSLDYCKDRELADDLTEVFGVEGFPSLVLLKRDGTILSNNARVSVSQYGAESFPWDSESIKRGEEVLLKKEEEAIEAQKNGAGVVVRRIVGPIGSIQYDAVDRVLEFKNGFSTAVLDDSAVTQGLLYYEVEILEMVSGYPLAQFGFSLKDAFAKTNEDTGDGAGDNGKSWGVCGFRKELWHKGESVPMDDPLSTSGWETGDVLGFAVNVDARKIAISKNGSWSKEAGYGVVFEKGALEEAGGDGVGIHPALTCRGLKVRLNVLEKDFRFSKPSGDVWESLNDSPSGRTLPAGDARGTWATETLEESRVTPEQRLLGNFAFVPGDETVLPLHIPTDRIFDVQWNPPGHPELIASLLLPPFGSERAGCDGSYTFVKQNETMSLVQRGAGGAICTVFAEVDFLVVSDEVLMMNGRNAAEDQGIPGGGYGTLIKGRKIPAGDARGTWATETLEESGVTPEQWLLGNFAFVPGDEKILPPGVETANPEALP